MRRTSLRRRSLRPRRQPIDTAEFAGTDWPALTDVLWARCGGYCEACGYPLPDRWDRHHRLKRGLGGDTVPNLVALHSSCHVISPSAVHMRPTWARSRGLIVSEYQATPEAVGLWLPDGRLVRLTPEGTYDTFLGEEPSA